MKVYSTYAYYVDTIIREASVGALLERVDERALGVRPEHGGAVRAPRAPRQQWEHRAVKRRPRGDDCWCEGGDAVGQHTAGHRPDPGSPELVGAKVHPEPAVDLDIDEARREDVAVAIDHP